MDNQITIVVLDYTSSTSERARKGLEFLIPKSILVILLNSGLKNEQLGADTNPCGTVRFVGRESEFYLLSEIQKLGSKLGEPVPSITYQIRQSYKIIGAVLSMNDILHGSTILKRKKKKIIPISEADDVLLDELGVTEYADFFKNFNDSEYEENVDYLISNDVKAFVESMGISMWDIKDFLEKDKDLLEGVVYHRDLIESIIEDGDEDIFELFQTLQNIKCENEDDNDDFDLEEVLNELQQKIYDNLQGSDNYNATSSSNEYSE